MASRRAGGFGIWIERVGAVAALAVTLAILGFYASRLGMPLPIFAGDEGAYLIRALYPDEVVARNPFVTAVANGVHLSVIRAAYETGGPYIVIDRLVNALAYLGGMVGLWAVSVKGAPRREQIALLLLAVGFAYWRFAASNLAEGLYVGVLALACIATGRWYRSRPLLHAVLAGALLAVLVLVKPHGVAVAAALAAVAAMEGALSRDWRRLPLRVGLAAAAFFGLGNLIQLAAQEPAAHPLSFFVGDFYAGIVDQKTPGGVSGLGLQNFVGMASASALLAGAPVVAGLADLGQRWRLAGHALRLRGRDLVFLLLVASLGATLIMVTIFGMKISGTPGEGHRLWGRYFEFFAPMLWLAAAPALSGRISRGTALACGAVTFAGLSGLLSVLQGGVVLFPWDASVLTAFFQPDPVRATLTVGLPYRALAAATALVCALALGLRARPAYAGLVLILVLSGLSTWLDHVWLDPMVQQRAALDRDARRIAPLLPPEPALVVLLARDANDGHLGFLQLRARPRVMLGPPGQTPPAALTGADAVVVSAPDAPPGGPWTPAYRGEALSLFRRAPVGSLSGG